MSATTGSVTGKKAMVLNILAGLVGLAFIAFGFGKATSNPEMVKNFTHFGLPEWLLVEVGIFEVIGGLLFAIPRLASLGGIIGTAIMTVAIGAHASQGEWDSLPMPVIFLALFLTVGWLRRGDLFALLGPRHGSSPQH